MSSNLPQSNPKRLPLPSHLHLRSPLLDGKITKNKNNLKGKKTYYNPHEDKPQNIIDKTLDSILFAGKEKMTTSVGKNEINPINEKLIDSLEILFKIANIFICAIGGIFSIIEFINIVRTIYNGDFSLTNNIFVFLIVFVGTILTSLLCYGFIHLIKTTKYIHSNIENQNKKIERLLNCIDSK